MSGMVTLYAVPVLATPRYERLLAAAREARDATALLDITEEREDDGDPDGPYERIINAAIRADHALVRTFVAVMRDGYAAGDPLMYGILAGLDAWVDGGAA